MPDLPINQIIHGNCLEVMKDWPDGCIDCGVTSPPYYGLRDYGIPPSDWPEVSFSPIPGLPAMTIPAETSVHGLEKNIWAYVAHEVLIFREVRRVLSNHATLWLNLGDTYSNDTKWGGKSGGKRVRRDKDCDPKRGLTAPGQPMHHCNDLKPKDLCAIPWRVALALQADGWWLRAACPWLKQNPMVESCFDRPTTTIEHIFLFAKSKKYFYDTQGVKLLSSDPDDNRKSRANMDHKRAPTEQMAAIRPGSATYPTRLRRSSDWFFESWWKGLLLDGDGGPLAFVVNPQGSSDKHYAAFPPDLVEPMILAGCPKEVCVACGKPRERIVEKNRRATRPGKNTKVNKDGIGDEIAPARLDPNIIGNRDPERHVTDTQTVGWSDCGCGRGFRPGIVFDPFSGSGTVGYVAAKLKRAYILTELNPEYVQNIAHVRLQEAELGLPVKEARAGQGALFGDSP